MNMDFSAIVQNIVTFMPAFLLALVVHEYAHAWMANLFGDNTSEWQGRLTLNPLVHMDPLGTVAFPLLSIVMGSPIFFGWAKPVPIDPSRFSHYRKGLFWVAFAGPLSNVLLGFFTAFALVGFRIYGQNALGYGPAIDAMLESLLILNFSLAIFNLIPVPPLDGSNIVLSFLSIEASRKFLQFQQFSGFLLLFLMFSGAFRFLGIPILYLAQGSIGIAARVFGYALAG